MHGGPADGEVTLTREFCSFASEHLYPGQRFLSVCFFSQGRLATKPHLRVRRAADARGSYRL